MTRAEVLARLEDGATVNTRIGDHRERVVFFDFKHAGTYVRVWPTEGRIEMNGQVTVVTPDVLVYFRRVRQTINEEGVPIHMEAEYHVGLPEHVIVIQE